MLNKKHKYLKEHNSKNKKDRRRNQNLPENKNKIK